MNSPSILVFFSMTILLVFYPLKCEARDSMDMNTPLSDRGDTLVSAGNRFELGFFTPQGNEKGHRYIGLWYYKLSPRTIVWVANRDYLVLDICGVFGIRTDGNLKIWCNNEVVYQNTYLEEYTTSCRTLKLLDSGNLVLFDGDTRLWQSFDVPTDIFLPGMKIIDNMLFTSWISPSDPGTGNYKFYRDQDQGVYSIQKRSTIYWKSGELGPLGIFLYNELPYFVAQILSDYDTRLDHKTYKTPVKGNGYRFLNYSRVSYYNNTRLLMNSSGEIQYYYHSLADGGRWSLLWKEPHDSCSVYC